MPLPSHPADPLSCQGMDAAVARPIGQPVVTLAAETARLYAADWQHFRTWCRRQGETCLPATDAALAAHLLCEAGRLGAGALGRRRAAIRRVHRDHGVPQPTLDAAARACLRRVLRAREPGPRLARSQSPRHWTASDLRRIAARCPPDLAGLRDRALLLVLAAVTDEPRAAASAERGHPHRLPHGAVLGLLAEGVELAAPGARLRFGVPGGPALTIGLSRQPAVHPACPVRALEDWLGASDTRFGPVFRKVDRWDNVEHAGLGPDGIRRILARRDPGARRRPGQPGAAP